MQDKLLETISLAGLEIAPSQVCGAIRLVPLLRRNVPGDLRLAKRSYGDDFAVVDTDPKHSYCSYIPHGFVLSWGDGGSEAALGTQMAKADGRQIKFKSATIRRLHRMVKREQGNQLRLLPMDLAMEGFLSLYFNGPDIAWTEYSRHFRREGFSMRWEMALPASCIRGFDDALRTFEIHEGQSGVLVFVADELASAFVTPCPADYRALHDTLLEDYYGELIYQYALFHRGVPHAVSRVADERVNSLADLRRELKRMREEWTQFHEIMAGDLLGVSVKPKRIYQAGTFTLQRFITNLDPKGENHMGEAIVRSDGTLEYLKTYRLSAAQTRRAYLLGQLANADWNLDDAAAALQTTRHELVHRLDNAGFGYIINEPVLTAARKSRRGPKPDRSMTL